MASARMQPILIKNFDWKMTKWKTTRIKVKMAFNIALLLNAIFSAFFRRIQNNKDKKSYTKYISADLCISGKKKCFLFS